MYRIYPRIFVFLVYLYNYTLASIGRYRVIWYTNGDINNKDFYQPGLGFIYYISTLPWLLFHRRVHSVRHGRPSTYILESALQQWFDCAKSGALEPLLEG